MGPAETESPRSVPCVTARNIILSDVSLGTRLRYSLVADEDVKKATKQSAKRWSVSLFSVGGNVVYVIFLITETVTPPGGGKDWFELDKIRPHHQIARAGHKC